MREDQFNPQAYGPVFAEVLSGDRRRPLDATAAPGSDRGPLGSFTVEAAFAHTAVRDADAVRCCLAGCWLLVDDLDASHRVSQSIATPAGSWWHGVMHRREGDYGNAKYWMRQAAWRPAVDPLVERFREWDSVAFVGRCERALNSGDAAEIDACLDRQQAEWEALFDACYTSAVG